MARGWVGSDLLPASYQEGRMKPALLVLLILSAACSSSVGPPAPACPPGQHEECADVGPPMMVVVDCACVVGEGP